MCFSERSSKSSDPNHDLVCSWLGEQAFRPPSPGFLASHIRSFRFLSKAKLSGNLPDRLDSGRKVLKSR